MLELDAVVFAPLMEVKAKMGLKELDVALLYFMFANLIELVLEWMTGEVINRHQKEDRWHGI